MQDRIQPTRTIYNYIPRDLADTLTDYRPIPWGMAGLILFGLALFGAFCAFFFVGAFLFLELDVGTALRASYVGATLFFLFAGICWLDVIARAVTLRNGGGYALVILRNVSGSEPKRVCLAILQTRQVVHYLNGRMREIAGVTIRLPLFGDRQTAGEVLLKQRLPRRLSGLEFSRTGRFRIIGYDLETAAPSVELADADGRVERLGLLQAFNRLEEEVARMSEDETASQEPGPVPPECHAPAPDPLPAT